ncbi:TlyA family RNA methyltransferase [Oerskovia sp. Sa1BUA8]|uniref:TlyA family RNA methyltransferase n=1 Tax=Oerskovia douganii TaxID=2762210 RepID=A0A9D5UIW9_9CELL|nr:TlyA family RNA methyltransferase [Oerskovia douganii]MBE7701382.1 TlyA family RNA methyltransferase [Oerskovia douganii]
MGARVDAELVRRGLARSRRQAAELVVAGRVTVDGRTASKPSLPVGDEQVLVVEQDPTDPGYASRAAFKLAGALDAVAATAPGAAPVVTGASCLDLGASTGGFTDVLLRRGARRVVAVDVGHDQLVPGLREDPRVVVREGFNVRDLRPDDLDEAPDVVVADLSFISLRLVLPPVAAVVGPGAHLLLMVKPQFEVGRERLGAGGVVRDPALHARAVLDVALEADALGLRPLGVVPSPLPGPSGNREFFVWLRASGGSVRADRDELERAVARAVSSPVETVPLVALVGEPADDPRTGDVGHVTSPPAPRGPADLQDSQTVPDDGAPTQDRGAAADQHRPTGGAL